MGSNYESLTPGGHNDWSTKEFQEWLQTEEGREAVKKRAEASDKLGSKSVDETIELKQTDQTEN